MLVVARSIVSFSRQTSVERKTRAGIASLSQEKLTLPCATTHCHLQLDHSLADKSRNTVLFVFPGFRNSQSWWLICSTLGGSWRFFFYAVWWFLVLGSTAWFGDLPATLLLTCDLLLRPRGNHRHLKLLTYPPWCRPFFGFLAWALVVDSLDTVQNCTRLLVVDKAFFFRTLDFERLLALPSCKKVGLSHAACLCVCVCVLYVCVLLNRVDSFV